MSDILNHKLAVAVLVMNQENKILLVEGPNRGWEFPGGYVGVRESIIEAAIREVKEESGIIIQLFDFLGMEQNLATSTSVVILKSKPVGGELAVSDESQDVGYFTFDEAMNKIKNETFKSRIIRCLNKNDIPFLIVK